MKKKKKVSINVSKRVRQSRGESSKKVLRLSSNITFQNAAEQFKFTSLDAAMHD